MEFFKHVVESFCRFHTVLLEPLNAKVLDGRPESVEAGLNPGGLDGHCVVRVVWGRLVHHLLCGRHESAKSNTPGADHNENGRLEHDIEEGNLVYRVMIFSLVSMKLSSIKGTSNIINIIF